MAQRTTTIVELVDDLDGSKATETVSFGLDGAVFEIDLSARNARVMRKALGVYTKAGRAAADPAAAPEDETPPEPKPRARRAAARKPPQRKAPANEGAAGKVAGKPATKRGPATDKAAGPSAAAIRAWASEQQLDVPARGRIPAPVREQFLQATAGAAGATASVEASAIEG